MLTDIIIYLTMGIIAGIAGGYLGIGGGIVMVPFMVLWGVPLVNAVGTSLLAIILLSVSGTIKSFRSDEIHLKKVLPIALGGLSSSALGASLVTILPISQLFFAFSGFAIFLLLLMGFSKKQGTNPIVEKKLLIKDALKRFFTGIAAGFSSGFFGVGGGGIMVPLQLLLLGENIKTAIKISLAVIVPIAGIALISHFYFGNVFLFEGLLLGLGGIVGVQIGLYLLKKSSEKLAKIILKIFILCVSIYYFLRGLCA